MPTQPTANTENRERVRASADDALPERLLYSRKQAAELLGGISSATLKRLEEEGTLKPVRLAKAKRTVTGQVFYTHSNLMSVARGGGDDA